MILSIPAESLQTVISPSCLIQIVSCVLNQILTSAFQVRVQRAPSVMISLMDTPAHVRQVSASKKAILAETVLLNYFNYYRPR